MKLSALIILIFAVGSAVAQSNDAFRISFPRWGPSIKAGTVYNFDTDMENGGSFDVNRYFIEAGIARMWSFDRMVAISAGYGQDDYTFSDLGTQPWNNIDNYRIGLFARWRVSEGWVLFAGPSVRSYSEAGTDLDDALTGQFFGGASYTFGDRLTLGPGVVVAGQIEDETRYFPVLLVNWNITERWSLETGGGFAATAGPGLTLAYTPSKKWKMGISARYENKRFRLNESGLAENGVGEDRSIPVTAGVTYSIYPQGTISGLLGYNISGKLTAEDRDGALLYKKSYNPAPIIGVVASFRL